MNKKFLKGKVLLSTALAAILFAGCGDSRDEFVITNTNIVGAPVAANDAFNALGNATVNQAAAGVLTNDAVNGAAISSFDAVGNQGGTVVLNADGSFAYTPVFGFVGAETFSYTLTNNAGSSTGTVTMTSTGSGFFVDNTAAPGGNGSQATPFDTLAAAIAAASAGDTIFVDRGDGTNTGLTGGINLPAGVDLIGEGTGLILPQTIVPAGQQPSIEGPITCGGNNTISGLNIDGSASDLIIINGVGDVTVSNNTLGNPTNEHINCDDASGTLTISGNTFETPASNDEDYINLTNTDVNVTCSVSGNTFTNAASNDVESLTEVISQGTSEMNVTYSNNQAVGAVADQFDFGFYFENNGTGTCTTTVDGNTFTNFINYPIGVFSTDSAIGGTVSGNTVSNVSGGPEGGQGIWVSPGGGSTINVDQNIISNVLDGIEVYFDPGAGTAIVTNNNVTNASDDGFQVSNFFGNDDGLLAIRNNTLTDSGDRSIEVDWLNDILCLDITGNTVNDNMFFSETGAGTINIERLDGGTGGPLDTVNTFNAGVVEATVGNVNAVAIGTCAIP